MLAQVPTFDETIGSIFTKTDLPRMMRGFLLVQVPPIKSLGVFASCVSGEDALQEAILDPAGFGALPEDQKLPVRGRVAAAWSLARKRFGEVHASDKSKGAHPETSITSEKRLQIISNFQCRYGHSVPPDVLPSERTLALAHNARRRRSAEPIPFSLIMSVKDGDNSNTTGYAPVATGSAVLVVARTNQKKNHQWMHSIPHYMHTVEVLLLAYVMVSTLDGAGQEWLRLDVAHTYLAKLRKLERMNAVSGPNIWPHIAECETHTRNERHGKNLADPSLSLGDIIALSLEHDRFPDATKFPPSKFQGTAQPPNSRTIFRKRPPHVRHTRSSLREDKAHTNAIAKQTRNRQPAAPRGNPYMEKDLRRRNQRNSRSHGIACKYAHDATEMATIQA